MTAMKDWRSQAHVKWECKYHVVILPKYRRKVLYGRLRQPIQFCPADVFRADDRRHPCWARVMNSGLRLAEELGALLLSVFQDSKRVNKGIGAARWK